MRINIYVIEKKNRDRLYTPLIEHYQKICRPFAKVELFEIFTKNIAKSHDISTQVAQKSYTIALTNYLKGNFNIALSPNGNELDSYEFSNLFKNRSSINFFIGGAFGFERDFLLKCNSSVSFGKITMSHKLAKVVLMEQIFRGLSILNNHPYHK